jgi:uncharacterized protein
MPQEMRPGYRWLQFAFVCLFAGLTCGSAAKAQPSFPALTGRVVDQADILDSAARARIEAKLEQLEIKTRNQLVVTTLRSLQGYDIADYGYRLGRHWGIGQKNINNGAILIVAPNERKVRIEVGYGLEGTITDAVSRLIIENAVLPRFRAGDFPGGIERGVDDLILLLSGDAEDFKRRAAEQRDRPSGTTGLSSFALVVLMILIWLVVFVRRSQRKSYSARRRVPWWIPMGGPGYSGGGWSGGRWSGGGSSSGASGGGFSGGGGTFGGGGASGSW